MMLGLLVSLALTFYGLFLRHKHPFVLRTAFCVPQHSALGTQYEIRDYACKALAGQ